MKMRLTFVAIGLLGLSGCCSCAYFDDACTRPEESLASGLHCGRREEWPRAYMNITAKECGLIADGMGEDVVLGSLLGLCLLPDVACSLCVALVTMPWQLSRYKDFPEKRTMDPSLVNNSSWSDPTYRGAAVPEISRSLRSRQAADGRWTGGKSVLADTALVALALAWRGEYLRCNTQVEGDDNFAPMLRDAEKYLVRCCTVSGDTVRLLGEDADPRAFPIAAAALAELGGRIHREETWTLAQKCLSRAAAELVREQQVELTELSAERLGWLVLALEAGLNGGWKTDGIEDALDAVRARLLDYPPLKGTYYDTRRLYAGFLRGDSDLEAQYRARIKENNKWLLDNIGSGEIVRGAEGKLHWKSALYRRENTTGLRDSGLGQTADDALGVLQVTFPVSHRPSASQNPSASQKAKEDI